ncbi:MAG: N-acetylmuramic acid 6-phosphate etherase [Spirochaetales bacterium]|nr:N-acetylmuramic acid 6-phosphate etherase [Spirochaetales bacterium]
MADVNLTGMTTETRNEASSDLDTMTSLEIVTLMNSEDSKIAAAVKAQLPEIAKAVDLCVDSLEKGGRIIYIGAGTSGRLGAIDAAECPPTFGVAPGTVVGLIAGGQSIDISLSADREDSPQCGREDLSGIALNGKDTVVGVAASGRTPYVIGGMEYARSLGCHTVSIACNKGSTIGNLADVAIEVIVGPEVLTGSTRLKAGTSQKMILNMISTASMVRTGKCYKNLMVDVVQTNAKLEARAVGILVAATGISKDEAASVLKKAGGSVKKAVVMVLSSCSPEEAEERLKASKGHVREALG